MKAEKFSTIVVATTIFLYAFAPRAAGQTPNVVIQWNEALQAQFGTANGIHLRALPMMHIAMFDAINSIEDRYTPYLGRMKGAHGASAEAAAAAAARDVLAAIYPAQQTAFDDLLASQLAGMPRGSTRQGVAVGQAAAKAVLDWRKNDGWPTTQEAVNFPDASYVLPPFPGLWQPTPPLNGPPSLTFYPNVLPFAMLTATQFLPPSPPTLISERYAVDFNEVAAFGRVDSTARRPDQTAQALFWTDHDLRQWNDGMLALAADARLGLVETARMLALAHVAGGDAMIACFDAKYTYWFWRPFQAIPQADADRNDRTDADATWQPLRPTPAFPEYPSAHACHSTAVSEALQAFFGERRIAFTLDSRATGTIHRFRDFGEVVRDVDDARVLAGFHFRHSDEDGSALGRRVARYVVRHRFRQLE